MWQMVVAAQVGRRRANERLADRLNDVLGVREWAADNHEWSVLLAIALGAVLVATVICLLRSDLRVIAALMISHGALVLTTPMWFLHYAGLTAAPLALTLGGAVGAVMAWCGSRRWLARLAAGLVLAGIVIFALPLRHLDLGDRRPPPAAVAAVLAGRAGCVTTDWPMTLIQLDLLQRDIDRGCRFVVDLGGYSYYLTDSPDHLQSRRHNRDWQRLALDYYRSGTAVIPVRFSTASGFAPSTAREIARWPVIMKADGIVVRRPLPADG
jgi:hypothetical protein